MQFLGRILCSTEMKVTVGFRVLETSNGKLEGKEKFPSVEPLFLKRTLKMYFEFCFGYFNI